MIRFVGHKDIDPIRWNTTILSAQFPTLLCTFEMLNILTGTSTWNALIENDYERIMPLPERSKLFIHYIYTPFFISQMGIFSAQETTAEKVAEFLHAIPNRYKQVDLLLNISNDDEAISQHTISLISHQLKLSPDYDTLFRGFSQNTQRNIKSARKQNLLYITEGITVERIIALFRTHRGQEKAVHFQDNDYHLLQQAAKYLQQKGQLDVIGVQNENGELLAGALMVRDGQRVWFWFSGRNNLFAAQKPMFFLLDEYIQIHAGQNLIIDFNGSMNENVARFYKGFGGVPYPIPMIQRSAQGGWQSLLKIYRKLKS